MYWFTRNWYRYIRKRKRQGVDMFKETDYNFAVFDFVSDFVSDTADDVEFWAEETEYDMTRLAEYRIDREAFIECVNDLLESFEEAKFSAEEFVDAFFELEMDGNETAKRFYEK